MSDDIPTPFYFLENIRKHLTTLNFNNFIDLGCGSGRVIYFISRSFKTINFFGIEYFDDQYNSAIKLFKNRKNIKIIKKDFTKINFLKLKIDCFFFNNPFRSEKIFINFVNNLIKKIKVKRRIIFIFVNFKPASLLKIRKIKQISRFYVSSNKGFSIFYLN
ncbi:MAG: methyltransferase domain-containing protein [Pelagibacteraceae bacterium]